MMKKPNLSTDTLLKVLDALFSVAALPLVTYGHFRDDSEFLLINAALFVVLFTAKSLQALRARRGGAQSCTWLWTKAGIYLACVPILLLIPDKNTARSVAGILLTVTMIAEMIRYIWKYRSFSTVFFCMAAILTLIFVIRGDYYRVLIYILVQVFIHVLLLSFSQMNLKVLIRIIRKTYAADILAGLLLLVTAASFMLPAVEKTMPTFKDAMWYCFSIVTTIGYGSRAADSDVGMMITVILGVYGLVVVALITSIIVNFYMEVKSEPDEEKNDMPLN